MTGGALDGHYGWQDGRRLLDANGDIDDEVCPAGGERGDCTCGVFLLCGCETDPGCQCDNAAGGGR